MTQATTKCALAGICDSYEFNEDKTMHTYQQWCEHYGYDVDSAEAKNEYERYQAALDVLESLNTDATKPNTKTTHDHVTVTNLSTCNSDEKTSYPMR